jgi:hypothetical protein
VEEGFAALVRGPSSTFPRGYPWLIPVWVAAVVIGLYVGWTQVVGNLPWWYRDLALGGLLFAGLTLLLVLGTVRHLAFRADANGIRLGVRTSRKRPRKRQVHLWWADLQRVAIYPRFGGSKVEITLGPSTRIARHRSPVRQGLLMIGMLVMPLWLGRGAPRLTEQRSGTPHFRMRLVDLSPEELGLALAALAPAEMEILVMSRRRGPMLARRAAATAQPAA